MLTQTLLLLSVVGVGVLHTVVPDHWLPIAVLARQRGWTRLETARASAVAGTGHVLTTLLLGVVVWIVGATAAARYGTVVDAAASLALIGFGLWIAWGAWRESRPASDQHHDHHGPDGHHHGSHGHSHVHSHGHAHNHAHEPWARDALYAPLQAAVAERHAHWHRHGQGPAHFHWHDHDAASAHAIGPDSAAAAPLHLHRHGTSGRTALLLVLGSSPMVEGIPAFFAAARYGAVYIAIMAALFAVSTILTYVALSVASASGLQRLRLGPIERYGEVLSGLLIAAVGLIFGLLSVL